MTHTIVYDAAIIGGGLGGLTLAIKLAQKGHSVLLLEKETYPFHKVCGEYISLESYDFLESCGLNLSDLQVPIITQLGVSAPNGTYLKSELPLGGFGISRFTLDKLLFDLCLKTGVIALQNCKVNTVEFNQNLFTIQSSEGLFKARYTFGAYGKKSNLDIHLNRDFTKEIKQGKSNYIGVKYHIEIPFPDNLIELHNFEDGYCGISKIDGNKYCLCYLSTQENLSKNSNQIKEMERNILFKNPYLKKIFSEAKFLYQKPLVISQVRFEPKPVIEQHVIMLGDASGLIAPLCGNGMSMAMRAADIISKIFPSDLESEKVRADFERQYKKLWKANFSTRLAFGRSFQKLFGSAKITWLVIVLLKPFPSLLKKLIRLSHGEKF
ncbi:MAG: tryptophan 7-halogenase [Bacteroidia bacterium]|nr:tryptophan 7-halogenase [Bacteroidia bacterium]